MIKPIPDVIDKPQFLKFVEVYAKKFRANNGFGRWLHEYQEKILQDNFHLGFIREQAIYYIGVFAQDAAEAYYKTREAYLYKITIITGETAVDDDNDEYTELEYDEAVEICKALNDEAEEELFFVKRM